jgi:hypothetical protein
VKRLILLAALAGCAQESGTATNTIAPAEARPAPTPPSAAANRPAISTSGSPPPASALAPGTFRIGIERDGLEMRKLIPQGHAVFHIENRTGQAHAIVVRGAGGEASTDVPQTGRAVVQLVVGPGRYDVFCTVAGHSERAAFETYVAGAPLKLPGG